MELNIDIESVVAQSVAAALHPDRLQPIITKQVEKAVDNAIEEQFGYRAPFRKLLEEKMAGVMPTDLENIGRFGDLVLKTIQEQLLTMQNEAIKQTIEDRLKKMLKPLPPVMKLSELVKQFTEHFSDEFKRDGAESPTFIVDNEHDGYWDFYADPKDYKDKYSCRIKLRFKNSDGVEGSECWACTVDEDDFKSRKYIGPIFNDEALAFSLYTGQVRVILDQKDFSDVYYEGEDY